jgi:4-aminobutyrate aminotransferase
VLDYIEHVLFASQRAADEVAAILVEPIQGEGGYIVPPDGFLAGLRALCDRHGILLIFDEVQSGVGRTGKMFAGEHWGVRAGHHDPGQGLGLRPADRPVVAKRGVMEQWPRGAHGNTFGGNPVCCAAAFATLDLVEHEYAANAAVVGAHFMNRLRRARSAARGDRRGPRQGPDDRHGAGQNDRGSRTPARQLCDASSTRAFHNGLLLLSCGSSTVRFMPPLSVSEAEVDEALGLLRTSLEEAL